MDGYLPKKELIFFNPGKAGAVFAHPANLFISVKELINVQKHLVQKTNNSIIYIEDRRLEPR